MCFFNMWLHALSSVRTRCDPSFNKQPLLPKDVFLPGFVEIDRVVTFLKVINVFSLYCYYPLLENVVVPSFEQN